MREFLMLRHGESQWNAASRWQGWVDVDLTDLGAEQAVARGRSLAGGTTAFAGIYASDLVRARRTAEIIAAELGAASVATNQGFRERCGGDWQGLTRAEIETRYPAEFAAWRAGTIAAPPNGESTETILERFDAAIARVHADTADGPVLIISHGGILRVAALRAGAPVRAVFPNLGGLWLRYDGTVLVAGEILSDSRLGDFVE